MYGKKRSLYYKDCLALRPRYKVDEEFARVIMGAIEKKVIGFYKEYLQSESGTNDEVT